MASNTCSPPRVRAQKPPKSALAAEILAAGEPLRALIGSLEPQDVPLSWAPEVMKAFASVQRLAESGRVLMTARAAEAKQWEQDRFASPADWLANQLGTTPGRAKADLETSERLAGLGATSDAVREGRLSPEQAGAVADAAAVNPDAEKDLLEQAQKDSLRRTRQEAERRKAEARSEAEKAERDRRVRRERNLRFWYGNGAGHAEVRGPVADVKAFEALIQREVDRAFRANRAPDKREGRGAYAFDALMNLGRTGTTGATGATGDGPTGDGPGRGRSGWVPLTRLTLVRVDLAALMRGWAGVGELCEIGGIPVSVDELRRVLGESVVQLVLTNGEAVVDVVNLHRKPTVAQRIAKLFTDSCCTAQGCDRAARLEFDHRHDWARVQTTELANLDLLCDHHHDLKTYEGWQLVDGTGRRPMVPPSDTRHPNPAGAGAGAEAGAGDAGSAGRTARRSDDAGPPAGPPVGGDRPGAADLVERLEQIRAREAERRAQNSGQDSLFDTG